MHTVATLTCFCVVRPWLLYERRVLMQKVARELLTMPDGPASVEVILLAQQTFLCMRGPALSCDG